MVRDCYYLIPVKLQQVAILIIFDIFYFSAYHLSVDSSSFEFLQSIVNTCIIFQLSK